MVEHRSSTSHYSDADDGETIGPGIHPRPHSAADQSNEIGLKGHLADAKLEIPPVVEKLDVTPPREKLAIPPVYDPSDIPPVIGPPEPDNNDAMSEAERRESDQFLTEHKEEEAITPGDKGTIDLAASASAFTVAYPDPSLVHRHNGSIVEEEDDLDSWIAASMDDSEGAGGRGVLRNGHLNGLAHHLEGQHLDKEADDLR